MPRIRIALQIYGCDVGSVGQSQPPEGVMRAVKKNIDSLDMHSVLLHEHLPFVLLV